MSPAEWLLASPVIAALTGAVLVMVLDIAGRAKAGIAACALALATAAGLAVWGALTLGAQPVASVFILGSGASGAAFVVYALAFAALTAGMSRLARSSHGGEMAALVAFAAAATQALMSSLDILIMAISLEAIALASYALVASARNDRSDEAAMKYFVQGSVVAALLFYGLSVLIPVTGNNLHLVRLSERLTTLESAQPGMTAFVLVLAAFAFKLGAFPFHSWAPDAYEAAPPAITSFLSSAPKIGAAVGAFIVLQLTVFGSEDYIHMTWLFAALAVASIAFGNFGGLKQVSYTRMLAYSGIAQVGYLMVGFASGSSSLLPVVVFVVMYAVAACGAFLVAQEAERIRPGWDGTIAGLGGLASEAPVLAASSVVLMLSLTGIPLTAGFWGKFLVFGQTVDAQLVWLAVIGVIGSVVSFGYYGGVIRAMYLDEAPAQGASGVSSHATDAEEESGESVGEEPRGESEEDAESVGVDLQAGAAPSRRLSAAGIVIAVLSLITVGVGVAPLFVGFDFLVKMFAIE